MHLTQIVLSRFAYGQIETRRRGRQYVLRGDIEIIVLNNGTLEVVCFWVASKNVLGPNPHKWLKCQLNSFCYQERLYQYDEEELTETGILRLFIPTDPYEDEIFLYPADGCRLDPRHVEGIEYPEFIHP